MPTIVSDTGPLRYLVLVEAIDVFARLKTTNFRCRPELLDALLATHATL